MRYGDSSLGIVELIGNVISHVVFIWKDLNDDNNIRIQDDPFVPPPQLAMVGSSSFLAVQGTKPLG